MRYRVDQAGTYEAGFFYSDFFFRSLAVHRIEIIQ